MSSPTRDGERRLPLMIGIAGISVAAILIAVVALLGRRTGTQLTHGPVHAAIIIGNDPQIRLDRGVGALSPDVWFKLFE